MMTPKVKQLCKHFVSAMEADNKPEALQWFSRLMTNKINDRVQAKKEDILASKKI